MHLELSRRRVWEDRLATSVTWSSAALIGLVFAWLLCDVVVHGVGHLSWSYLTTAPLDAGRAGGIGPILVSTLALLGVCLAVAVPAGLGTAILLAEFSGAGSHFGRFVRLCLDVLAAVPSIVFGLFGNAVFCVALGMGFSILSGGLTLACMVLPILIRSIELGLRSVPDAHREAAAALSISRTRLIVHVLLPAAGPGLAAGLILGIGRALAETAALIFTSGSVDRMPGSWFDSGRAISMHIYDMAMNVAGGEPRAYAAALVLVGLLIAINMAACWLTERLLTRRTATR